MRSLLLKYWSLFYVHEDKGDSKFNGIQFEKLVRDILELNFDGQWEPTSVSWDGGRDFVSRSIQGDVSWVECKMYKKSLPIAAIANTLVMAVNESVEEILIFSYSKLNPNSLKHLASYSGTTDIKVQIFDDNKLESLILESNILLSKYFPSFSKRFQKLISEDLRLIKTASQFTKDIHIHFCDLAEQEGLKKPRFAEIALRSSCLLEIFIESGSIQPIEIEIFLEPLIKNKSFLILNRNHLKLSDSDVYRKILPSGGIHSTKIYLSPIRAGFTTISDIKIRDENDQYYHLPNLPVNILGLNHPGIIGSNFINALEDFNQIISACNMVHCHVITGQSGVGKTRFLEEAKTKLVTNNFTIRHFDGSSGYLGSFSQFIKSLLAKIWFLPDPTKLGFVPNNEFFSTKNPNNAFEKVNQILYQWERIEIEKERETLLALAVKGLLNNRMALLVDNVQHLDTQTVNFIQELVDLIVGQAGQNSILLVFNLNDIILSESASILLAHLKSNAARQRSLYQLIHLKEFNYDQVCSFLDNVIAYNQRGETFTQAYPMLAELIYTSVLPRPLDLFQMLKSQEENGFMEVKEEFFWIKDLKEFHTLVRKLQPSTESILEFRLNYIKEISEDEGKQPIAIIILLSHFGQLDESLCADLAGGREGINFLKKAGIIKPGFEDEIVFYHPSLERFFSEKVRSKNLFNDKVINDLVLLLKNNSLLSNERLRIFAIESLIREDLNDQILDALNYFRKQTSITYSISNCALEKYFYNDNQKVVSVENYLDVILKLCKASSLDLESYVGKIRNYYKQLENYVPKNNDLAQNYYWMVREVASLTRLLHDPIKGDDILKQQLSNLEYKAKNISPLVRTRIKADLYDRRSVCHNAMKNPNQAEEFGLLAMSTASNHALKDVKCLALIDLGYIFYNYDTNLPHLVKYWDQALLIADECGSEVYAVNYAMRHAVSLLKAQLSILKRDVTQKRIMELLDSHNKQSKQDGQAYYLTKGLLTKALFNLQLATNMKETLDNQRLEEGLALITYAQDVAMSSALNELYTKSVLLEAQILGKLGFIEEAMTRYNALAQKLKGSLVKSRYGPSFTDLSIIANILSFWNTYIPNEDYPFTTDWLYRHGQKNLVSRVKVKSVPFHSVYQGHNIILPII